MFASQDDQCEVNWISSIMSNIIIRRFALLYFRSLSFSSFSFYHLIPCSLIKSLYCVTLVAAMLSFSLWRLLVRLIFLRTFLFVWIFWVFQKELHSSREKLYAYWTDIIGVYSVYWCRNRQCRSETFANARKSSKSEFQILKFKKLPGCRFCAQSRSTKAIGRSETFRSKILIAKLEQVFTSFYTSSIKFKFRGLGGWFMDCKMSEDAV